MHIEYEISERDYLHAQHLAIKNHPRRSVRWTRAGLPIFGLLLLLGFVFNFVLMITVMKQPFPWGSLLGLLIPAFFISSPPEQAKPTEAICQEHFLARQALSHGGRRRTRIGRTELSVEGRLVGFRFLLRR